jgi:hypothetical protein
MFPKRIQFSVRSILIATAVFAVGICLAMPTQTALRFQKSFHLQSETVTLHWLSEELRHAVFAQTKALGLTTTRCASYTPSFLPLTFDDIIHARRRMLLVHSGAWDPLDRESYTRQLDEWAAGSLEDPMPALNPSGVELHIGLATIHVFPSDASRSEVR